jgi:hypothetical protein
MPQADDGDPHSRRDVPPGMPPGALPRAGATSHRAWGGAPGCFRPPLWGSEPPRLAQGVCCHSTSALARGSRLNRKRTNLPDTFGEHRG